MKRLGLIAVIAIVVLGGCAGTPVTEEQATEAFGVSFGAYFMAAMSAAFGNAPEGVEMNEEGTEVTFTDFDVSEMKTDYSTMSGTFVGSDEGGLVADLTFTGGIVETISYSIDDVEDAQEVTVTVNGKEMTVTNPGQ